MFLPSIEQKPPACVPIFEALQNFSYVDVVLFLQLLLNLIRAYDFCHVPPTVHVNFVYTIYAAFPRQSNQCKTLKIKVFFKKTPSLYFFVYTKACAMVNPFASENHSRWALIKRAFSATLQPF
ncbi:hypothetical protein [Pseudomonas sp. 58 R 3]|nr:hypothetical protein [Pseudomonas sp. 58 R 3]